MTHSTEKANCTAPTSKIKHVRAVNGDISLIVRITVTVKQYKKAPHVSQTQTHLAINPVCLTN